jgi:hypothetical protein
MTYSRIHSLIERLLILPALVLCIGSPAAFAAAVGGGDYYVSGVGDDATGDGSEANPWRTITHAVAQAGGGAPTVFVGAGTYEEAAGEVFPIQIDQHDRAGISIRASVNGLGEDAPRPLIIPGDASGAALTSLPSYGIFYANDFIEGEVVVAGLEVDGLASSGNWMPLLDLNEGAEKATVTGNLVAGHALLNFDTDLQLNGFKGEVTSRAYDVVVVDNEVVQSDQPITLDFYQGDGLVAEIDILVEGNLFEDIEGTAVWVENHNHGVGYIDAIIVENEVIGARRGINFYTGPHYASEWDGPVSSSAAYTDHAIVLDIAENYIADVSTGIRFGASEIYQTCPTEIDVLIAGNEIEGAEDYAIYCSTSWSSPSVGAVRQETVIEDNYIHECDSGIYHYAYGEPAMAERALVLIDNNIQANYGVYLSEYTIDGSGGSSSSTSGHQGQYDLIVEGNRIDGDSGGIYAYHYYSESANTEVNATIEKNDISSAGTGLYWGFSAYSYSDAPLEVNLSMRGNVLHNQGGYTNIYLSNHYTMEASHDFGSAEAFGYNTLLEPAAGLMGKSSSSWNTSVVFHSHTSSSMYYAENNMVGNWWGTQDAGEIEARVLHGGNGGESGYAVDLSNPLPNQLDFTVEVIDADYDFWDGYGEDVDEDFSGAGALVFTAGDDAGFVSHAGLEDGQFTLTGPPFFAGIGDTLPRSFYSPDYKLLAIPYFPGALPVGDYDICVYNPGGQSGCGSFTVDFGSDEDCSQNQIPTAMSDDVDTDPGVAIVVDVTANDWDPNDNLDPTNIQIIDGPDKGFVPFITPEGHIVYVPNSDLVDDSDTLTYVVYDTCGSPSNAATLHIRIGGAGTGGDGNQIPTAMYDEVVTEQDAAIVVDVLANDYDADGDALNPDSVVIIDTPGKGSATINADGSITYTPSPGVASTTDTFTYTVEDEHGATSNAATVGVMINYATDGEDITGGAGGNAGGRTTQGARGGVGNGGTPTYGGTRTP